MLTFVLIKKIFIDLLRLLQFFQTLKKLPVGQIFLIYYRSAGLKMLRTTALNDGYRTFNFSYSRRFSEISAKKMSIEEILR